MEECSWSNLSYVGLAQKVSTLRAESLLEPALTVVLLCNEYK
jgi:hypothetical protein